MRERARSRGKQAPGRAPSYAAATMPKQRYDTSVRIQPLGDNHKSSILGTAEFHPNVSAVLQRARCQYRLSEMNVRWPVRSSHQHRI